MSKKKILIVDDDKSMVDAIHRVLRKNQKNYELESAFDGFDAGLKFSEFKPDLIILDIKMPGVDGYHLCSHIRHNPKNRNTKILFISGITDKKELIQSQRLGANDFLIKPFTNQMLKEKVESLLLGKD